MSPTELGRVINHVFYFRCDACLQAEGNHFQCLLYMRWVRKFQLQCIGLELFTLSLIVVVRRNLILSAVHWSKAWTQTEGRFKKRWALYCFASRETVCAITNDIVFPHTPRYWATCLKLQRLPFVQEVTGSFLSRIGLWQFWLRANAGNRAQMSIWQFRS